MIIQFIIINNNNNDNLWCRHLRQMEFRGAAINICIGFVIVSIPCQRPAVPTSDFRDFLQSVGTCAEIEPQGLPQPPFRTSFPIYHSQRDISRCHGAPEIDTAPKHNEQTFQGVLSVYFLSFAIKLLKHSPTMNIRK